MAAETVSGSGHFVETLTAEDFETASVRSAAPSYISEAPSYHSTVPNSEPIPPYSPPDRSVNTTAGPTPRHNSAPTLLPPSTSHDNTPRGLPPIPPAPPRRQSDIMPTLGAFRIPSWSTVHSNPTARHYQAVAHRRAAAAETAASSLQGLKRVVLERVEEEERSRFRPLEDPYLVGEEAARRARNARLARENGDAILIRENQRWDWFFAQSRDWDEREQSWNNFRRNIELGPRGKLARRIGARFSAR